MLNSYALSNLILASAPQGSLANPIVAPIGGWFAKVGRSYRVTLEHAGALGMLGWDTLVSIVTLKVRLRDILNQLHIMGVQSLPIVFVTATLAGIVTSQQGGYQLISSSPQYILGTLVVQSVVLELAPLLTAIVLVGRIGARITAELGTMVVSEQIDAFKSLGRDPSIDYCGSSNYRGCFDDAAPSRFRKRDRHQCGNAHGRF